MSDASPEFEIVNSIGSTENLEGTTELVPPAVKALPAIADKFIEEFTIENLSPADDPLRTPLININSEIHYSLDGVIFDTIYAGQAATIRPKQVKQVIIKGNVPSVPYRFRANYEVFE